MKLPDRRLKINKRKYFFHTMKLQNLLPRGVVEAERIFGLKSALQKLMEYRFVGSY